MIAGEGASLSRVALPLFSPVKAVCTKFGRPAFTVPPVLGTMPGGGVVRWFRWSLSVADRFVCRCLTNSTLLPFPHPAHRTGRADLPHPALGEDSRNGRSHCL
jgi:hypothetical protein